MKYRVDSCDGKLHLNFNSIEEIAEFFEVSKRVVNNWLSGKSKPKRNLYIEQIYIKGELIFDYKEGLIVCESR